MRLNDLLKIGSKNFFRHGFKTVGAIVIITVGIIVYILLYGFFSGIQSSMNETVTENENLTYIEVTQSSQGNVDYEDADSLKRIDGVDTAFPKVTALVGLENDELRQTTTLLGVPEEAVPFYSRNELKFDDNKEIILNNSIGEIEANEKLNMSYTVKIKEGEGVRESQPILIKGTYEQPQLINYPNDISLAPMELVLEVNAAFHQLSVEDYMQTNPPEMITVIAEDVEQVVNVAQQIEDAGFETNYSLKSSQGIPSVAKFIIIIGAIIVFIMLSFAAISISSIMSQSLKSRYKEIGIMKAIGFKNGDVHKILSAEVIFIGLTSYIAAIFSAASIIYAVNYYIGSTQELEVLSVDFGVFQVLSSFILVILVSLGASFRSITKAARLEPAEILRRE
jgi:putative ABC transport system permease protein